MKTTFYKYQGTGNDFIIIDNRDKHIDATNTKRIAELCDRRFGIGADGLILLENDMDSDFKMVYFNADGNESSMCGNGGRCITAFANYLGLIKEATTFNAIDGLHNATIENKVVALGMQDVTDITTKPNYTFLDTGSPHHVELVNNIDNFNVKQQGAKIRYSDVYGKEGSNINFVEPETENIFKVRTYERGVEDETLSCGTGVTAVALAMHRIGKTQSKAITLKTLGGNLKITFDSSDSGYTNIWLIGLAQQVFKGEIEW